MKKKIISSFCLAVCVGFASANAFQNKSPGEQWLDKGKSFLKKNNLDSARFYALKAMEAFNQKGLEKLYAQAALLKAQSSYKIEPREALNSYLYARRLGKDAGENAVQFRADLTIGAIYRRETKYDSTKHYYTEAEKLVNAMLLADRSPDNLRRMGMLYNNMGAYYSEIEQPSKAVFYLVETEKIGRELKDTGMMFRSAVNAGAIYNELGSPENKVSTGFTQKIFLQKAIVYFKIAFNLLTPEDEEYKPAVLNNMGLAYLNLGKFDSSAICLKEALTLHYKYKSDNDRICNCTDNLGASYYRLKQYGAAETQFNNAISLAEKNDIKGCLISALSNLGQLYTMQNKLTEAETVLKRALELKNTIKGSRENYLLYEKLYLLYEKKQDFKQAYNFYKLFVSAKDSIADVEHLNLMDEIDIKYSSEKKDEKISELSLEKQLLEEKNRTREAQLRLREFWIIGIIIFVFMAGIIGWFWIQRNRLKLKQEAVDLEHRLLRARMNPHFLFNGLNTIQKHYADGHSEEANQFMADFSTFLRLILNKTGETKQTLEDEIEFTTLYASLEQRKYPDKIKFTTEIAPGLETEQWMVPSLLFQPIVENAIWHGILPANKNGEIKLKLYENASHGLVCEITDNGIGFDVSMANKRGTHVSKAFELLQKRLGKKGSMQVETLNNAQTGETGTRITLTLNADQ